MTTLARYLIELEHPAGGWEQIQQLTGRTRAVAEQLRQQGQQVRFLRAVFVPEDDACFFLVEGPSAAVVRQLVGAAGLESGHIGEALNAVGTSEQKEHGQ